jgi:hypothetical protein
MSLIRYRRLDANDDPERGQGRANFATDLEAVCQAILTRLRLFEGEWFENILEGLPLWTEILGSSGNNKEVIDRLIQERIAGTKFVLSVGNVQSSLINRAYSFTCLVNTYFGTVTITNNQVKP